MSDASGPSPPHAPAHRTLRRAVFIDKDGTLVENVPYSVDTARLRFAPAAPQALGALANAGYAIVVVSNQSGIARGLFSAEAFERLRSVLEQRLRDEAGVVLTDVLHCPHAPRDDGLPQCACRKPEPGMLLEAARRHGIDLGASWIVGDTLDDIEAGHRAGCRGVLYDSGGETVWRLSPLRRPEARLTDWDEVVHRILAPCAMALE